MFNIHVEQKTPFIHMILFQVIVWTLCDEQRHSRWAKGGKRELQECTEREWKKAVLALPERLMLAMNVCGFVFFHAFCPTMNYKRNYISSKVTEFGFYELFFFPFFFCWCMVYPTRIQFITSGNGALWNCLNSLLYEVIQRVNEMCVREFSFQKICILHIYEWEKSLQHWNTSLPQLKNIFSNIFFKRK